MPLKKIGLESKSCVFRQQTSQASVFSYVFCVLIYKIRFRNHLLPNRALVDAQQIRLWNSVENSKFIFRKSNVY